MTCKDTHINEQTWDAIAESFDKTRQKPWDQCIDFIKKLPEEYTVVDIGCGNGRHLFPCAKQCERTIGVDISRKLLRIVNNKIRKEHLNKIVLIHSDMINIPIKDESVDSVMCIASIHNIKGKYQRIQSLNEIFRILKKNGIALISVWSRWQDRYRMHFLKQLIKREKEFGDIDIYWRQNKLNIPRFYHLYSKGEFLNDLTKANFKIQQIQSVKLHSKLTADNYFAEVKKE